MDFPNAVRCRASTVKCPGNASAAMRLFLLQEAFLNYLMGHSMSKVASFVRLKWSVFILKFYCNSAFSDLLYGLLCIAILVKQNFLQFGISLALKGSCFFPGRRQCRHQLTVGIYVAAN